MVNGRDILTETLMNVDDRFKRKQVKSPSIPQAAFRRSTSSPSLTQSQMSAGFRKTETGTYYFPNGEIFRPRTTPSKRNRPSKIPPRASSLTNVPQATEVPRSNSMVSMNRKYDPARRMDQTRQSRLDLQSSLRGSRTDITTNLDIEPQHKHNKLHSSNLMRSPDAASISGAHGPYDALLSPSQRNKSVSTLTDSNPSSLVNYAMNRSDSNTPSTSITSEDDHESKRSGKASVDQSESDDDRLEFSPGPIPVIKEAKVSLFHVGTAPEQVSPAAQPSQQLESDQSCLNNHQDSRDSTTDSFSSAHESVYSGTKSPSSMSPDARKESSEDETLIEDPFRLAPDANHLHKQDLSATETSLEPIDEVKAKLMQPPEPATQVVETFLVTEIIESQPEEPQLPTSSSSRELREVKFANPPAPNMQSITDALDLVMSESEAMSNPATPDPNHHSLNTLHEVSEETMSVMSKPSMELSPPDVFSTPPEVFTTPPQNFSSVMDAHSPEYPEPDIVDEHIDNILVSSNVVAPVEAPAPTTPTFVEFDKTEPFEKFVSDNQYVPPRGDVAVVEGKIRKHERQSSSISSFNSLINAEPIKSPLSARSAQSTDNSPLRQSVKAEPTAPVVPVKKYSTMLFADPPKPNMDKSLPPSPERITSEKKTPRRIAPSSPLKSPVAPKVPAKTAKPKEKTLRKSTSSSNFKSIFKKIFRSDQPRLDPPVVALPVKPSPVPKVQVSSAPPSPTKSSRESIVSKASGASAPKNVFSPKFFTPPTFLRRDGPESPAAKKAPKIFPFSKKSTLAPPSKMDPVLNRVSMVESFVLDISELPKIETEDHLFDDVLGEFDEKLNRVDSIKPTKKLLINEPFIKDDELTQDQIEDQQKRDKTGSDDSLPERVHSRTNSDELYVDDNIRYLREELVWPIDNDDTFVVDERSVLSRNSSILNYESENGQETVIVDNEQLVNLFKNFNENLRRRLPIHLKHIRQFQDYKVLEINVRRFENLANTKLEPTTPTELTSCLKSVGERKQSPNRVMFSNKISINETFPPEMYKRYNKSVTQYTLTESFQINKIKNEVNQYKCNEMLVHESSQGNTHFYY